MSERNHMTLAEFKTLQKRDWTNGAVRDELYQSVKRMEELETDRRNLLDNDLKALICVEQQQEIIDLKATIERVNAINPNEFSDPYDYEIMMEALEQKP